MIHNPLHPGEIIRHICVENTGLTVKEVAKKLDVDRTTFSRLLNKHAGVSAEMAVRLAEALNTSESLWMNLQRDYDIWKIKQRRKKLHVEKLHAAVAV